MLELNVVTIVFFIFAVLSIGGALGVVLSRNLIHGALFLIVSLFGAAGLFVLLAAPFMAAVQVLVYIGAIAILIIFAIMLTRSMSSLREIFNRQWWASALAALILMAVLTVGVVLPVWGPNGTQADREVAESTATLTDFGVALVDGNQFVLPFEIASLLLTAAMVGAIVIARDNE